MVGTGGGGRRLYGHTGVTIFLAWPRRPGHPGPGPGNKEQGLLVQGARAQGLGPMVLTSISVEVTPAPLKMKPRYTLRDTATVSRFDIHEIMVKW